MAYEFELPVNFEAERIVIGTLINSNRLVYGGKMIDCGIVYIDKNWFFGSFYQDVFTVVKIFQKEDKDLNKMDIAQYMVEHDMGDATDIYKSINEITKFCTGEEEFWNFVKLIERLYWQREQYKLVDYLVKALGGKENGQKRSV